MLSGPRLPRAHIIPHLKHAFVNVKRDNPPCAIIFVNRTIFIVNSPPLCIRSAVKSLVTIRKMSGEVLFQLTTEYRLHIGEELEVQFTLYTVRRIVSHSVTALGNNAPRIGDQVDVYLEETGGASRSIKAIGKPGLAHLKAGEALLDRALYKCPS